MTTDRLEDEIRRLTAGAVEAAEAHGRGAEVIEPGSPVGRGLARRRYLAVAGVAVLVVGVLVVGLVRAQEGARRVETQVSSTAPTVDLPAAPSCPPDPGGRPIPDRSTSSSDAVAALLRQQVPGFELTGGQTCGSIHFMAALASGAGPAGATLSVIYGYRAPDPDPAATFRRNVPSARVLTGLPSGLTGVASPSADGPPHFLVVEQAVPPGQSPLFVEFEVNGSLTTGVTADGLQALAVEILTTIAPPGA